jgi:transketolase
MRLFHEPSAMVLTRQNLPVVDRTVYAAADGAARGAYVLACSGDPQVILMGSGSEVSLCLEAHERLKAEGIRSRVVSMPCFSLFAREAESYRNEVLPPSVRARVAVEQGATLGWERYVGLDGEIVGMQTFGASAPFKDLQRHFGFTADRVLAAAHATIAKATGANR